MTRPSAIATNTYFAGMLGLIYSLQGDQEEAGRWFGKAARAAPDNPMFLVNDANNQMYRGNLEEAEQGLRKALAIDPATPHAHWVLAGLRYVYVPLILMALPNAKIIHVRRNPMDACFACFKQLFADA